MIPYRPTPTNHDLIETYDVLLVLCFIEHISVPSNTQIPPKKSNWMHMRKWRYIIVSFVPSSHRTQFYNQQKNLFIRSLLWRLSCIRSQKNFIVCISKKIPYPFAWWWGRLRITNKGLVLVHYFPLPKLYDHLSYRIASFLMFKLCITTVAVAVGQQWVTHGCEIIHKYQCHHVM